MKVDGIQYDRFRSTSRNCTEHRKKRSAKTRSQCNYDESKGYLTHHVYRLPLLLNLFPTFTLDISLYIMQCAPNKPILFRTGVLCIENSVKSGRTANACTFLALFRKQGVPEVAKPLVVSATLASLAAFVFANSSVSEQHQVMDERGS